MSNKSVVVLAPNGRRQNVKVTPNTTILQVLEEVCRKQGLKAEEYDITHHNRVMDATSIMRYTGLPNNAQLEMAVAVRARAETQVKVGLALENGSRVMGEFKPSDTLWDVVVALCPAEADETDVSGVLPVIFYLGREECGVDNLKKTTLRSLGLTSGGAILRFFKKTPEELHHQANVSAPLSRSVPSKENLTPPLIRTASLAGTTSIKEISIEDHNIKESILKECEEDSEKSSTGPSVTGLTTDSNEAFSLNISHLPASVIEKQQPESEDMDIVYEDSYQSTQISSPLDTHTPSLESLPQNVTNTTDEDPNETIVFLGERNAVLFDVATAKVCNAEDVPEDFFDLTVDDAKQLIRDMKRRQAALEEQPLVTAQYRELEKSKMMLNTLHQYKRCVLKVQFPNQLVLQGTFTPLEKVSHVLDFVKKYLQDPNIDFCIFTAPPKKILSAPQTLYDANCVPGALVYFASSAPCPESGSYIREDIMNQVSSASAAAAAAASFRSKNISSNKAVQQTHTLSNPKGQSVSFSQSTVPKSTGGSSKDSDPKVPKWFKGKK